MPRKKKLGAARLAGRRERNKPQGKQAARFHAIRARLIAGIERLVRAAQANGRIRRAEKPAFVARYVFFVYSAALRWWIASPRPDVRRGLAELRRLLALQLNGLRR